jgi:hypothetical protein
MNLKRFIPHKNYVEGEKIDVEYRIIGNQGNLNFEMKDDFAGSSQNKIKASTKKSFIKHSFNLDNGFGEFYFNEVTISLSDRLELFTFVLTFLKKEKVIVEPYVQRIKEFSYIPSFDSRMLGEYEFIKKGYSPSFYGLREYRYGDAFKFINWKASQRYKKTIVNEYENIQSLNTCFWLELNTTDHMGEGVNSTWEYTRDLTLSLVKNNLEKNHSIQFSTNTFVSDDSSNDIFKELKIRLSKERYEHKREQKFSFYDSIGRFEQGADLFLIQPLYLSNNLTANIDFLIKNSAYFGNKKLFLIDGYQSMKSLDPGEFLSRIQVEQKNANDYLLEHKKRLTLAEIEVYIITIRKPHLLREQTEKVL